MSTPKAKSAPASPALHPASGLLRETFLYKASWPRMLTSNLVLAVALVVSGGMNVAQFMRKPDPQYFAATPDGRLTPLIPLSVPMVNTDAVLEFSQACMTESFTLDFVDENLRRKLQSLRSCYTTAGYNALMAAMDSSGLIKKIRERRYVASATSGGAGVISATDPHSPGGYKWTVQQPINITLQNQTEKKSYTFVMETDIQRIPTVDNPKGIATAAVRIIGTNN
jgi:intracellular multiplication protein IcmL